MVSLLEDKEIKHPDLICIITTDEETGMYGAKALDAGVFEDASYLINMDSENEDECLSGCAGGLRIDGRIPVNRATANGRQLDITVKGLRGGHSGAEIHKGITNAVRLLARILEELKSFAGYTVLSLSGGEKDNAIPSFAKASLILDDGFDRSQIEGYLKDIEAKYRRREKSISITAEFKDETSALTCTKDSFENVLFALLALPNGVQALSPDIEGLVETSLNLGVFALNEDEAKFNISLRSSVLGEKEFLSGSVRRILEKAGGTGTENSEYPAWEYKPVSKLRDAYAKAFEKTHGIPVKFNVIHAGLECGLFAKMKPELDMISIGPEMHDIHSPKERLNLSSSISLYKTVEELLSTIE